jgi:hypothetical protein
LHTSFRRIGLTLEDFNDKRFSRLYWLRHLLDTGSLDDSLRWTEARAQVA